MDFKDWIVVSLMGALLLSILFLYLNNESWKNSFDTMEKNYLDCYDDYTIKCSIMFKIDAPQPGGWLQFPIYASRTCGSMREYCSELEEYCKISEDKERIYVFSEYPWEGPNATN